MIGHRTLNLEDYLGIFKRRGWIILIPLVILPIITYSASYTVAPQYLSKTTILIDSQKVPDSLVKPVVSSDLDSRLASMREQILSRTSLQPIIERYNLYANKHMSMDDRIDLARKSIGIELITSEISHSGGLPGFSISFKAGDAHTAQMVCGEITSLFTGENLKSREASAEGTTDFIKSQLADAKRSLDEQDAKLAAFQSQYMGRLPGEEATNMGMLSSLNTQLEATTQQVQQMEQNKSYEEAMLAGQTQATQNAAAASASGVPVSPQAQLGLQTQLDTLEAQEADLTAHYTADYPDVIAVKKKIAALRKQIAAAQAPAPAASSTAAVPAMPSRPDSLPVQQLRAQIRAIDLGIQNKRKEQAQIQAQIGAYQGRISSSPLVEQQYKELTRDHQTAEAFYNDLLSKMNQSKMATDLEKRQQGEQFRMLDEPNLPDAPFSPKRSVFLFGGIFAGLAVGLSIAAFLEFKSPVLRTERDIWAFTKLPTLAVIAFAGDMPVAPKTSRLRRLFGRKKAANLALEARG